MSAYPLYSWNLEPSISFSYAGAGGGVIGVPALVIDANQNTYFAAVVIGQNPTASPSVPANYKLYNNIVVGSTDKNGNLLWYRFFSELVVAANQQQVSLVIGTNNDLYVAFVTPAAVSNRYNMSTTPSWCPPLYPEAGVEGTNDIVLARINYSNTSQTVAWVIQNARLNSVYDETAPQLAIDTTTGLLYITYQTDGDILCYTPVGTPSVALSCFTLYGAQLWLECQANINSAGANTNPVVTADNTGGVYVAYETTATVSGGAVITEQQVEMVKFQTYLTASNTLASYSRQWVLSQNGTILTEPPGISSSPSVTCDGTNVYIAFLTTGAVNGNYPTGSTNDLVVAQITPTGYTPWIQQGSQFNRAPYTYADASLPYITADYKLMNNDVPNILVSLQTYTVSPQDGDSSIFVFKMSSATGDNIFDTNGYNNMPLAWTSAQQTTALLPTTAAGSYTQVAVKAIYGYLYFLLGSLVPLPFNVQTSPDADLILLKYNLAYYYPNTNPFEFMSQIKKICSCGANCSCQGNPSVPGVPFNLSITSGNELVLIYFIITTGGSPLINFSYSIDPPITMMYGLDDLVFTPFAPPQYESPVTISGLTNGVTYSIQIKAINGIGTGPASATVIATPGIPAVPTNLDIQPGDTTAVITFTPGSDNGSAITNYTYSTDGGATFTPFSPPQTTSPVTISGLTNGTLYTIQIAAVNAVGTGLPTANLYLRVGTPTSITNLAVDFAGDTVVTVSFTPGSDNGYAVTNYAYNTNGGATYFLFSPPQTTSPVTIGGLTNGTTYTFQLEGQNTYGLGPTSAAVTTTPGLPGVPTSLSGAGTSHTVTITFTPGVNNGSAITNYLYSLNGGATFVAFSPAQSASPVVISGLTNGTAYDIQLKAVNSSGTSVPSATVTVTPNPIPPILLLDAATYTSGSTWTNAGSASSALDMTLSGTYSKIADGGGSIEFGTDTSAVTTSPSTTLISNRTLNIWIKLTDVTNNAGGFGLSWTGGDNFEALDWNEQGYGWLFGSSNFDRSGGGSGQGTFDGGPPYNDIAYYDNVWHMLTAVYSTDYKIYMDGVLVYTITEAQQIATWGAPYLQIYGTGYISPYRIVLGPRDNPSYTGPGDSLVGNIALSYTYDYELQSADVLELYNSTKSRFPTPAPSAPPTSLSGVVGDTTATISFTAGASPYAPITNYQYSTDGGTTFTAFSPAQTSSPVTITGLTNYVTYSIKLKAVNVAGASTASAAISVTPQPPPLVLLQAYSYSGSGAWLDQSGNGRDATLTAGIIAKNAANNGIILDGSTYWTFPNVSAGTVWTMSVWYKNTAPVFNDGNCVLSQQYQATINMAIRINTGNPYGSFFGAFFDGGQWRDGTPFEMGNVWTYYQITWDGTTMKTYINGTLFGTTTPGGTSSSGGGDYNIGHRWDNNDFVIGEIGEVRIYNFPLDSTQILADYNSTVATYSLVPTPLVVLQASSYSGSGTWLDTSGNGYNATMTAGTIAKNGAGNGIVLDGSTYWSFPNVRAGFVWTMCTWYKNKGVPGNIYPCIVTAGNSGSNSNMFIGFLASPSLEAQPSFYYNATRYGGSSVTFTNGVWISVQVTWDGITMTTYLNGVLSGTATPGGASADGGGNYKIGICWDIYTNSYVTGEIGEVRIYGAPLTQAQVLTNYNSTKATYGF